MPRPRKKTNPDSVVKAVLYVRVSSQEQRDEGYSIEAQEDLLRKYCQRNDFHVVEVIEESESAKTSNRPGFKRIVKLLRTGQANTVIVEKTDRLYRNFSDYVTLDAVQPTIHLVKEGSILGPASRSHDKFVHGIKLLMAKNYIDNLSEEVQKSMTKKASTGHWPTHAPTGYRNISDGARRFIDIDPKTAPLVKKLFEIYATGDYSFHTLQLACTEFGLKTKLGRPYGKTGIQAMLRNPLYCGIVRWGGIDYPGKHAPIVSKDLWDRVQDVMAGRNISSERTHKPEFAYRGMVRCECGALLSPYLVRKKSGYENVYYQCARRCGEKPIPESSITEQFAQMLEGLWLDDELRVVLRIALRESFAAINEEDTRTREFLTARKDRVDTQLQNLYLEKLAGDIDADDYRRTRERLLSDQAKVEADLAAADRAKQASWQSCAEFIDEASNYADRFRNHDSEGKREMMKSATSNRSVKEKILTIEPELWFKLIREAALKTRHETDETVIRTVWLPNVDSNHD